MIPALHIGLRAERVALVWRHAGATTDDRRPAKAATKREKPARLTIDLPLDLHGHFKAACANKHTKMKDEVLRFIEQWTQKNG